MATMPEARVAGAPTASLGLALLVVQAACGAHAQLDTGSFGASAGEANGGASAGSQVAAGGEPNLIIPSAGGTSGQPASVPDGVNCRFAPPSCAAHDQWLSIDVATNETFTLSYPFDSSCGDCVDVGCEKEDCPVELTCSLWAAGRESCGSLNLSLAACNEPGGRGTCLNTASSSPYYVDPTGKRWNQVSLSGDASPLVAPPDGLADLDLTLAIGDDVTTQRLSVHAHVCAQFVQTLQICK